MKWVLLAALVASTLAVWPALAVTVVQLRSGDPVPVESGVITLGDIAVISSDDAEAEAQLRALRIAQAPPPGMSRSIDADIVRIAVRSLGYEPSFIGLEDAKDVTVVTRSNVVTSEMLFEIARQLILERLSFPPEAITIERNNTPPDFSVPSGVLTITPEPPPHEDFIGLSFVPFAVAVDGQLVRRVSLNLTVRVRAPVLVANHSIPRGAIVQASDFRIVERDLSSQPTGALLQAEQAIGKQAKMVIAADQVLCERMLELPPLVRSQDAVRIQVVCGQVVVNASGIALQDGRLGEEIRVVSSLGSRKALTATVVDVRTVLVTLPGGIPR